MDSNFIKNIFEKRNKNGTYPYVDYSYQIEFTEIRYIYFFFFLEYLLFKSYTKINNYF